MYIFLDRLRLEQVPYSRRLAATVRQAKRISSETFFGPAGLISQIKSEFLLSHLPKILLLLVVRGGYVKMGTINFDI